MMGTQYTAGIIKVANGYIVHGQYNIRSDTSPAPHVFETFDALVDHLRKTLEAPDGK